jgi:methyl-accepting chemotaxis protein
VVDKYSDNYKEFWKSLKDGKTTTIIQQYRLFNGDDIWLDQTFSPVPDSNGKIYKILNISSDITKTVKQNESLESQHAEIIRKNIELESLNNSVDTSLIMCEYSPEGIITSLNEKFAAVTGYSKKELLGKNNRIFLKDTEKDQFESIMEEVMKEKTWSGVTRRTLPSGEEKWLMSTVSSVKDENGSIYKVYHIAQDITEKRQKYQLLEEANKEIEKLKKRIKDLE